MKIEQLPKNYAKELAKLKQKKFREEEGKVVVEGIRLIEQLLTDGIKPQELITCDENFSGTLPFKGDFSGTIWQTTPSYMEQICDTQQPQTWAAVMPCTNRNIVENRFVLFLDNIQDPGNLGTIFRTAAAAGISGIVRSTTCCEIFNPKVIRASLGAVFFVPTEIHDSPYVEQFNGTRIAMCMDGEKSIFQYQHKEKNLLLILGSEAHGIQDNILKWADVRLRIPISQAMESLNVSVTAGISIFTLQNQISS
ncbi:MAG TPA: RNA methyltransferase [Candidatus Cloacimonadota bacterium]|nr:RNA methyltransferase [Candidatus Cloacimonadota bacterium]HPT71259.1 RNA methyltransferase [Candidatus Cloacimonadota bacterium]